MIATAAPAARRASLRERLRVLWPLSSGPREIRVLDGLRAVAALSVLTYHAVRVTTTHPVLLGVDVSFAWNFTQTGVHLFFILSGFLLFLPYARVLLQGRTLPSARRFYERRALRILPAYYVCLAILALLQLPSLLSLSGLGNVASHLVFLHDDFPAYNRMIEGPFWTLAVEWQFYLVLPLLAALVARIAGAARSVMRVAGGVLCVLLLALVLRAADAQANGYLTRTHGGTAHALLTLVVRVTMGSQGKFLEVFAVGMLCSVLYVAGTEQQRLSPRLARRIALPLSLAALAGMYALAQWDLRTTIDAPPYFKTISALDWGVLLGPLLIGMSYAALMMSILWGGRMLKAVFEARVLRFIGLISYSLYLWHLPIVQASVPFVDRLAPQVRTGGSLVFALCAATLVAYLSYQLVERPFLKRRAAVPRAATPALWTATGWVAADQGVSTDAR